jgi:tRNA U34 5-methylaminomethyl-2-thiouridine-forming methyltransferase MnmC
MHVFIEAGLRQIPIEKEFVSILEIGFGTGLNAWLTRLENAGNNRKIVYTTLETNPLEEPLITALNYTRESSGSDAASFSELHHAAWGFPVQLDAFFELYKVQKRLQEFIPDRTFDLIYFDAFGPPVQPEMWTAELFSKIFEVSNQGAIFVTYCAKGQVRRDLQSAGWSVERIPGPPGKREMLRATKTAQ